MRATLVGCLGVPITTTTIPGLTGLVDRVTITITEEIGLPPMEDTAGGTTITDVTASGKLLR